MIEVSLKKVVTHHKNKFIWLIISIIGIATLPPPAGMLTTSLDSSFAIGAMWATEKHLQIGQDVMMQIGPLGYLFTSAYQIPPLWFASMSYILFSHCFLLFSIGLLVTRFPINWKEYLLIFPLVMTFSFITNRLVDIPDQLQISVVILLYLVIRHKIDKKYKIFSLLFVSLLLAIHSLIKFDMTIMSISVITVFSLISVFRKEIKNAIIICATYSFSVPILWILSNQSLNNLPSYFIDGLFFSSGYSYGLALDGPQWQVYEAVIAIIFVIGLFFYSVVTRNKNLTIFILMNGIFFFESFKHGFVRQDAHVLYFYWTYGVFFILAYIIFKHDTDNVIHNKKRLILTLVLVLASVICVVHIDILAPKLIFPDVSQTVPKWASVYSLTFDKAYQNKIIEGFKNQARTEFSLDEKTIQTIGNKTMDILPWDVALSWAYNFNWHTSPTWQSFLVFSPKIDSMKASHFSDEKDAPRTILYGYKEIDNRYPLFDEPLTFKSVLQNYDYLYTSGEFAFLTYNPKHDNWGTPKVLGVVEGEIGKEIKIPKYDDGYTFAYIDMNLSPLGKIMNVFYKPSQSYIRFEYSDSTYSSQFRFIHGVANDGLFLSQYVGDINEFSSVLSGNITQNINGIIITADEPSHFEEHFQVKFVGIPAHVVSIQKNNDVNTTTPNWSLLKSVSGGSMYIDTIGNALYAQQGNTINIQSNNNLPFIDLKGWAVDDLAADGKVKTYIIFKNKEKEIVIPTHKVLRPDVAKFFSVENYQYGGWETVIDTSKFPKDCYKISLRILRSDNQEFFEKSGEKLICFN